MIYLIIVSIVWSLSFSLIKGSLTSIDPIFVAFLRMAISLIIFVPFFKKKSVNNKLVLHLLLIGAIQYGLMYIAYIYSFQFLKAYEIVILTIFTPLFIILIFDLWNQNFIWLHWIKAVLAVLGAGIIVTTDSTSIGLWIGIVLIQLSNLFFAFGQVYYKKIVKSGNFSEQAEYYLIIYLGAVITTGIASLFKTDFQTLNISLDQWLILIYLGAIASGAAFFLWNYGITKVEPGSIAVLNNLKIPLGVLFALLLLGESVNILQFLIGSIIIVIALTLEKLIRNR